jgi:hypothetical protein
MKEKIYNKLKGYIVRSSQVKEISARNDFPVNRVKEIYSKFSNKIYSKKNLGKDNLVSYNPLLQEKVFELTERYIDREKIRELMELANAEGKPFESIKISQDLSDLMEINDKF